MLTILSLLLTSSSASAGDDYKSVGVKAGGKVPFDAQCSTPELVARIAVKAHQCTELVKIELEHKQKLCDVDTSLLRQKHAIKNELAEDKIKVLNAQVKDATVWYRSPIFVATVSVVLTASVMLGARELIVETQ